MPLPAHTREQEKQEQEVKGMKAKSGTRKRITDLDVELTNRCNASCRICPRGEMKRPLGLMTEDTFETLRSRVEASSLKTIIFSGFGEPLLHPMLPQYVSGLKAVFPGVIQVNTNAALLSRDLARDLVASGLDKLNVSYNGPEQEEYEAVMRGMRFKTLEENIAGFIQARGRRVKPRLSLQCSMPEAMKTKKRLMRIASMLDVETVKIYGFNNRAGNLEGAGESPGIPLMDRFCCSVLFVAWDGTLYPCSHDIKGRQPLGHVLDFAFDEIEKEDYPMCRGCTVCDEEGMKEFKIWSAVVRRRLRRILPRERRCKR